MPHHDICVECKKQFACWETPCGLSLCLRCSVDHEPHKCPQCLEVGGGGDVLDY